jgi:outer membrane protein OmpA-like peptidoglycan-associated protein
MDRRLLCSFCMAALIAVPVVAQENPSSGSITQSTTTTTQTDPQNPGQVTTQETTTTTDANGNVIQMEKTPVFRVNVVARTLDAVNYQHKNGSTKVDLIGTNLMPEARGSARVNGHSGRLSIGTDFEHLKPAMSLGPQYLTYVLWAVTPDGRPVNLGEVLPKDDGKFDMQVTTQLQSFGLMVTAEPYFAVTRPSDMVVMENQIRRDTKGWEQPVTAKYESLTRDEYVKDLDPNTLPATGANLKKVPLNLLEARNAVAIADSVGAEKYAPEALARAKEFLAKGEDYLQRKQGSSAIGTVTRGAVQSGEDARLITLRKIRDEKIANERLAQQQRVDEARRRQQEEAENARLAQNQATQAQADREAALKAQADAQSAAAQAQQERAAAEQARQEALTQQQALAAQTQQANLQAQQAQDAAARAEREKEETRARLMTQLNQILQTKDSARGLIVNMSDVLFDLNRATLKPGAQLRLAKVAGIIQAYPDLRLQIEGFTDSTGSADYNQKLSEKRAQAVRDFLVSQGVSQEYITAQGLGEENPVASNDTAAGRQMNRRVDLVVSGESIQSARSQGVATPAGGAAGAAGNYTSPNATQNGNSVSSPATSNPANTVPPPPTTTQPNAPIQNSPQPPPNPAQPQTTTPQTNPQQQSLTPPPHGF